MRLGSRIITTMAVAFLVAPTLLLCADDTAKPAATAKKDGAVNSRVAPGAVAQAKLAATTAAPLPATPVPPSAIEPQGGGGRIRADHSRGADSNTPKAELFLGYSYLGYSFVRTVPLSYGNRILWLNGGTGSVAFNVNRYLGLVADIGGYRSNELRLVDPGLVQNRVVDAQGTVFTYLFGPRFSYRKHNRITPFAQVLFGGAHAGAVTVSSGCPAIGCTPLAADNALALAAGGGLDLKVSRHVALRLFQAEYLMTRFRDPFSTTGQRAMQGNVRLSAGIVFRFGGNPPPPPPNHSPAASCSADKSMVYAESGDVVGVRTEASDPDGDPLTYAWTASGGTLEGSGPGVRWNSSGTTPQTYSVRVRVDDGRGGTADCSVDVRVEPRPNRPPTMSCSADRSSVLVGEPVQITATASDPDNDPLTFSWRANAGRTIGSGSSVKFDTSDLAPGRYTVTGRVDDGRGGTADCSVNVEAQAPPPNAAAPMVTELEARLALHSIYFQTARPTVQAPNGGLLASQQTILRTLADDFKKYLTFKPDAHLILEGHADQRGSVEYNNALTERRVARSKSFLVEQGISTVSIETRSFGKQDMLSPAQVKQQMEENPDFTPEDRRKLLQGTNMQVIILAQNRRVDVVLKGTGQESVRRYPFNAKDALSLLSTKGTGTAKRTTPAAKRLPKK